MSPNPRPGGPRGSRPVLVALALILAAAAMLPWRRPDRPSAVDAGELAADPAADPCGEAIVTGEWVISMPAERGYMVVVLRGRDGGRVACHFEAVPAAERCGLETALNRSGEVVVHGRHAGVEEGVTVLRGCTLLD
ncbi:MAG TPA: hypothetical protein VFG68_23225 [Fimbriiglobus sp.]|nr:hypothetical protein [Fimbriiglobus sp.]